MGDVATKVGSYKELKDVPADRTRNVRNDTYLVSEVLRFSTKTGVLKLAPKDAMLVANCKRHIDDATKVHSGMGQASFATSPSRGFSRAPSRAS